MAAADAEKHLKDFGVPVVAAQALLSVILIYLLYINERMMEKILETNRPISNTSLLSFILFISDVSALIFKVSLFYIVKAHAEIDPNKDVLHTLVEVNRFRYVIMSVEMLFICIPIRHNFQTHKLEV